jgi:hypothetical protein
LSLGALTRLAKICDRACSENRRLRSVSIPGSVVKIELWAFTDCVSLEQVDFVLPSKLESIGSVSFRGCRSLTRFWIPASVTEIAGTFLQYSGVHEVTVDANNTKFRATEGFLLSRDGKSIVCYFGSDRDVRIGADIETVGNESFEECPLLRSVTFESGSQVKRIERDAFRSCERLERVRFGGACPSFGQFSFALCGKLREISLASPSDRLPVGTEAFIGSCLLKLT